MGTRRHKHKADSSDATTAQATSPADYDAAADLALPAVGDTPPDDGFVPYAAELAGESTGPGYDVTRDTGVTPG